MICKLKLSKRVLSELDDIYDYYQKSAIGLGNRFYEKFDKKLVQILTFPKSGVSKNESYRETYLPVFPLAIIYKYYEKNR